MGQKSPQGALVIRKQVSSFGNSAHVTLPKDWLGREVIVTPKDVLAYLAVERAGDYQPPGIVAGEEFSAFMQNEYHEHMVLTSPWKEPRPVLWHSDIGWEPLDVMHTEGELVVVRRATKADVTLNEPELAWIKTCLHTLRVEDYTALPEWKEGKTLEHQAARALLSGDKDKQIAVLEKFLEKLKSS